MLDKIQQIEQELRTAYDGHELTKIRYHNAPNPAILEFAATHAAELGLDFDDNKIVNGLYLHLGDADNRDEFEQQAYERRWELFKILELMLQDAYSESTNNDACSFEYLYTSRIEGTDGFELTIKITDHLS